MTRHPLLTAFAAVASALAGLAFYAWLRACAREESADADDIEALHAIADRRQPDMDARRAMAAWRRLYERGLYVLGDDGGYYLTLAGWAHVGRPLGDVAIHALRLSAFTGHRRRWSERKRAFKERHGISYAEIALGLETDGFIDENWSVTPAGRAVLESEART